jgi:ubiquinone/menaquinone biosynthesis C-methylase UbiE
MTMLARLWSGVIRFGFRLLYHEMAWTYDLVSRVVSFGEWRAWTRAALEQIDPPDAGAVLEIAHGTGNLQLDLYARGYRAIGLDISPQMGQIARGKLHRARYLPRLVRGSALMLPFADASFQSIVCTFPTPFILQPQTLHEAARVLRTGGRFVIVPNAVLVGGDAGTAALEWLYRVTGQRGGEGFDIAAYFALYGLRATVVSEQRQRSVVTVVVAEKAEN